MVISLNAVHFDELSFLTVPTAIQIEDTSIKYVFNHKKANQYDSAMSDVYYYDEQAATLKNIAVEETPRAIYAMVSIFALVTVQKSDAALMSQPRLLNKGSSYGYAVLLSPKDDLSLAMIAYSALAGGTFTQGDIITDQTTFAQAVVVFDDGAGFMVVHPIKRTIGVGNTIKSSDGLVTATVDSYTAALQKFHQYEEGLSSSARKKDLVVRENALSVNYAVTAVDIPNNSVTIAGDHQAEFTKDVPVFWNASTANDGMYSVQSSITTGGNTIIRFMQNIPNYIADGTIRTT